MHVVVRQPIPDASSRRFALARRIRPIGAAEGGTRTQISLPQGMIYCWWHFGQPLLDDLVFEIEFAAGGERTPGRYYQLYQGNIGGVGMYLEFQTDLFRPGPG